MSIRNNVLKKRQIFKKFHAVALFLTLISGSFLLTSCHGESLDVTESNASIDDYYCSATIDGSTKIDLILTFNNNSIYDLNKIYANFDLYKGDTFLKTVYDVELNWPIRHGRSKTIKTSFSVGYEVDGVGFNAWSGSYASFIKTYQVWVIATVIGIIVAIAAYLIVFFVDCFDEMYCFLSLLGIPVLLTFIGEIGWVPIAIVSCGIILFCLVGFIAHIIEG